MADMLASVEELRTYVRDETLDVAHAEQALVIATALVQAATRQRLVHVVADVVELRPTRMQALTLPEAPVTSVDAVDVRNYGDAVWSAYSATSWFVSGPQLITVDYWWDAYEGVRVTYSHGFTTPPEDLRAVVLSVAARTSTNPDGLRSESIGSYSYTLAGNNDAVGASLSSYERDVCNRYRTRTHAMR